MKPRIGLIHSRRPACPQSPNHPPQQHPPRSLFPRSVRSIIVSIVPRPIARSPQALITVFVLSVVLILAIPSVQAQQELPVRIERWLEITQLSGTVNWVRNGRSQTAQVGTRLSAVGDGLSTGADSSAVLSVDTDIGFITVSENTNLVIQELDTAPDGSRLTKLQVTTGQARIQIRPFTLPSRLEIETPAGVSGVRGTVFGISVGPTGDTGVATLEGNVLAEAQGEQVTVSAGLQSLIIPGEPPTPPEQLRDDPQLDIQILRRVESGDVQILGRVDPVNLLELAGELRPLDRDGGFELQLPLPADRRILVTVTTPLGTIQSYELIVP